MASVSTSLVRGWLPFCDGARDAVKFQETGLKLCPGLQLPNLPILCHLRIFGRISKMCGDQLQNRPRKLPQPQKKIDTRVQENIFVTQNLFARKDTLSGMR